MKNFPIRDLRFALCAILVWSSAFTRSLHAASSTITATIAVTNNPVTSNTLNITGVIRTWTNNTLSPASSFIATTNNTQNATTNLFVHISAYPFTNVNSVAYSNATNLILYGLIDTPLTVTIGGSWASVTYVTNVTTLGYNFTVPYTNIRATQRTNFFSWLIQWFNDATSTNSINAASTAMSNFVNLAASQTLGNKTITNSTISAGSVFTNGLIYPTNGLITGTIITNAAGYFTGGYGSNMVFHSPTLTNGANYGNAFRSPGSGANSEQFGASASATGASSVALGNTAVATNTGATALGNGAIAGGYQSLAFGPSARALENGSIAIGSESYADKTNAIAIGTVATASFINSIALGTSATTTATNQIMLGDSIYTVNIPGQLRVTGTITGLVSTLGGGTINGSVLDGGRHTNLVGLSGILTGLTNGILHTTTITNATIQNAISASGNNLNFTNGTIENVTHTNTIFRGTNVFNADISWSRFDLATIADGVNTALAFTNRFVRISGAPTADYSIAGLIGGRDGKEYVVWNDTAYSLTWRNDSGIEPTAGNRIKTPTAADITVPSRSFSQVLYSTTDNRWWLANTFPAAVTNGEFYATAFSQSNTATNLFTFTVNATSVAYFQAVVTGISTNAGATNAVAYDHVAAYKRTGNALAQVGSTTTTLNAEDVPASACALTFTTSDTNVVLQVSGLIAPTNIFWRGWIKVRNVPVL